uniref:Serpentine receptor class gamma n=1 Tax=Caenorhabditis tropicalis TaxID=1561998 RepID=A0A1I7T5C9_9PELO
MNSSFEGPILIKCDTSYDWKIECVKFVLQYLFLVPGLILNTLILKTIWLKYPKIYRPYSFFVIYSLDLMVIYYGFFFVYTTGSAPMFGLNFLSVDFLTVGSPIVILCASSSLRKHVIGREKHSQISSIMKARSRTN